MRKLTRLLSLCCALFVLPSTANAQTIFAPTIPETTATSSSNQRTLNCDMVQCPNYSNNTLKAIVWDEDGGGGSSWNSYLFVEYNGTVLTTTPIGFPGKCYPDVVIGDDLSDPGNKYIIAVVYMQYGTPNLMYIETYKVDLTTLAVPPLHGPVIMSDPLGNGKFPHIDLFADQANTIGGNPSLHKFVACWEGNSWNAVSGDISNVNTIPFSFTAITATKPDVATYTDAGNDYAVFVQEGQSSTTNIEEWDLTATPAWNATLSTSFKGYTPRVECMNVYGGGSTVKYQAVSMTNVGATTDIYTENDLAGGTAYYSAPLSGNFPLLPQVAAGIGSGPGIGNSQYSYSFYLWGSDILAQDIAIGTGTPAITTDFQQVNFNGTPSNALAEMANHALSSSSNTGYGLLSAWYDGTDILYKVTSTSTFGFKTTDIKKIDRGSIITVYPNPAHNTIRVNARDMERYMITSINGTMVGEGDVTGNNIDISDLTSGNYFIKLTGTSGTHTLSFVKN